jgi:ADP-ribosylglycohydrolase
VLDIDFAARAANSLLAGAIADTLWLRSDPEQPVLFDDVARLSGDMWLALATCEAVARSGRAMTPPDMHRVLDEWRDQGRLPPSEAGLGSLAIQVAPLAFVLHPDDERDLESLQALVSAIHDDHLAYATARATLLAMRECLERNRPPDLAVFAASHVLPPELTRAIALAGEHVDDLEAAIEDMAPPDDTRQVACLTGLLLGAAGCEMPRALALTTPERAAIDGVAEPFAQFVAAMAG